MFVIAAVVLIYGSIRKQPAPPIEVALNDGRILQIEGVTYGTHHKMGKGSEWLDRMTKKWSPKPKKLLHLDFFISTVDLPRPVIVIWANVIDPRTNMTNSPKGRSLPILAELVDKDGKGPPGQLFEQAFFMKNGLQRRAFMFDNYPQGEKLLTLRVASGLMTRPWRSEFSSIEFPNPHVVQRTNQNLLP